MRAVVVAIEYESRAVTVDLSAPEVQAGQVLIKVLAAQHPIVRSLEPGEDWSWCYIDQLGFRVDGIRGNTHIPPSPMLK
jgi:hypothetical protein